MKVICAKPEDREGFVKLALERAKVIKTKETKTFWNKMFEKLFKKKQLLIAKENNAVIGFLYYSYFMHYFPFVDLIWISEKHRRKNIARKLYSKLEEILKKQKHKKLMSSSDFDNYKSLKMHKALGFKKCGYIKDLGEVGEKEIFLSKNI